MRATDVQPAGSWEPARAVDRVVLDHDGRHRRRVRLVGEAGLEFLLDLPAARVLRDGDGLRLEDGRLVLVRAAPEPLAEIRCPTPALLARIAWHLGNRHLPTVIRADCLLIRRDHVIEAMVRDLGAEARHVEAVFDPEGGAYAGHGETGHGHAHSDGHRHD